MSEENNVENTDSEKTATKRRVIKSEVALVDVLSRAEGIDGYDKNNFHVRGPKNGTRVVFTKTPNVSRFYFYGQNDYQRLEPLRGQSGLLVYSEQDRKEKKLGGIMAEVEFDKLPAEDALRLIEELIELVRSAPVPAEKPKKVKKEKPSEDVTSSTEDESGSNEGEPSEA